MALCLPAGATANVIPYLPYLVKLLPYLVQLLPYLVQLLPYLDQLQKTSEV